MNTLEAGRQLVVDTLEALSWDVVTDPRSIRPPVVFVDIPSVVRVISSTIVELEVPIHLLAPPPGNATSLEFLLGKVDEAIATDLLITAGVPETFSVGGQELPSYQLTTRITVRRT